MYREYWQLEARPFVNDFDARFVYETPARQAAELKLAYAIENRLGAAVLTGPAGVGKTLLTNTLENRLGESRGPFVRLDYPQLSQRELLSYLAAELCPEGDVPPPWDAGLDRYFRHIEVSLLRHAAEERHPVIVVDRADAIDEAHVFQALEQLVEIRHREQRIATLLLAGEPNLLSRIRRIGPLSERIAVNGRVAPLEAGETTGYVEHRLQAAGAAEPIFDKGALAAVHELSAGIPMRINHLCELALLVGYAERSPLITAEHVHAVAEELVSIAA